MLNKKQMDMSKPISINQLMAFINKNSQMRKQAQQICLDLLKSDEFSNHSVEFEWEDGDAPSISSCQFDEDVVDAYITKIYLDGDIIKVNLHAYYINEDIEGVSLCDECDVDYFDILEYLNSRREEPEPTTTSKEHTIINSAYGEVMLVQSSEVCVEVYIGDNYDDFIGCFRGSIYVDTDILVHQVNKMLNDINGAQ